MGPKLFPSNPSEVMVIRKVTPDIVTLSLPFTRFGFFKFGGRGTMVKMASGSIAVFSPVNLTPEVKETISSLGGTVKYIAAPDLQHHLHVTAWKNAFPNAQIIAPEGLWEKRQSNPEFKDTPFDHIFKKSKYPQQTVNDEFDSEFETEYVHGHGSRELVFLHKPSRTVIEADLLFNMPANEQYSRSTEDGSSGFMTKLVSSMMTAQPPAIWQRRFAWYVLAAKDRQGFAESMKKIDRWDFDRIIPCHGDVIETGAKRIFEDVFAWFLDDAKKRR